MRLRVWLVALSCLLWPQLAAAQGNPQGAVVGGRSVLMGGTGVAIGMDGAVPVLNPAAILNLEERSLALTTRFIRLSRLTLQSWRQPGAVDPALVGNLSLEDPSVVDTSLQILPTGTCYFEDFGTGGPDEVSEAAGRRLPRGRAGHVQLAACIIETENDRLGVLADQRTGQSDTARVDFSNSVQSEWERQNFGLAFAIDLTDDVALGASAYMVRSGYDLQTLSASTVQDLVSGGGSYASTSRVITAQSWDLVTALGVLWRVREDLTIGASVRFPGIHILDSYDETLSVAFRNGESVQSARSGSFEAPLPPRLSLGVGFEFDRFRGEIDGFFDLGSFAYAEFSGQAQSVRVETGGVTQNDTAGASARDEARDMANLSVGGEIFITDHHSLLAGFGTDFSNLDTASQLRLLFSRTDAMHASLGYGSYGPLGELLTGLRFSYAYGEAASTNLFVQPLEQTVVDSKAWSLTLTLGGRLSFGTVIETAEDLITGDDEDEPKP